MINDKEIKEDKFSYFFVNEWPQFFTKCNWYDFTLAYIHVMNDKMFGNIEFDFVLFGLGVHMCFNYEKTELLGKLQKDTQEALAKFDEEQKGRDAK